MSRTLAFGILLFLLPALRAEEPLVIDLPVRASVNSRAVTVSSVGKITGGTAHSRALVGRVDLAEIGPKESSAPITRRQVEFRLRLAGYADEDFVVVGSERTAANLIRKPISTAEAIELAKAELLARLGRTEADVVLTLTQPVTAKMPEIAADDEVKLIADPNTPTVALGRTQMNVTVMIGGEKRFALPVYLESKLAADVWTVNPASYTTKAAPVDTPAVSKPVFVEKNAVVILKNRQRVKMTAQIGDLKITDDGEAQQDGKLGQLIRVMNVRSKTIISARVTGPDTVEVELGGGQ